MSANGCTLCRILLTLATGTGKTFIAFQTTWKLFQSRWNLSDWKADGAPTRRPRILFLADRNILADQGYNAFSAFPEDALVRIAPADIRKKGKVPKNGNIFFTIFQTFMSGQTEDGKPAPYFGEYPPDFFDFIVIDECHRGGANDESTWRAILEYFAPAVQLGLTATPKRKDNADTYRYFGEPVFIYSLKEGINDGFLTPFRVKQIATTLDEYIYTPDNAVVEGQIEAGKLYEEKDFNRIIEIKEREKKRVEILMAAIDQREKTLVFCANQTHALAVRDLVNQAKTSTDPNYCHRVTADDGALGEQHLRDFQAHHHFSDPEWDGEPIAPETCERCGAYPCVCEPQETDPCDLCRKVPCVSVKEPKPPCQVCGQRPCVCPKKGKARVKLADGKERAIQHMTMTSFWHPDGTPMSAQQFMEVLFGRLPEFFKDEDELRRLWSLSDTRARLLAGLRSRGSERRSLPRCRRSSMRRRATSSTCSPMSGTRSRRSRARSARHGRRSSSMRASPAPNRRSSTSCCCITCR